MRRAYVDVSRFRSPYDSPALTLTGLGQAVWNVAKWPAGRRYVDVAHFRAPYDQGYFQDNDLFGLGADAPVAPVVVTDEKAHGVGSLLMSAGAVVFTGALVGVGVGLGWQLARRLVARDG